MRLLMVWTVGVALLVNAGAIGAEPANKVDELLAKENAGKKVQEAPLVDDLAFLRRIYVDLVGRIPKEEEIQRYLALPSTERRTRIVDELLKRDAFADRWTIFFADMLRIRSNSQGGASLLAFVNRAIDVGMPYDVMCRQLLSATGKAGLTPEVGFILGDDADPYAMAGVTSQVFLGVRIACAQCHNHPHDVWKRKQFYDLAAYFGKSRKVEQRIKMRLIGVFLNETQQTMILWPPEDKSEGKERNPVKASFPFQLDEGDGPSKHIARLNELRTRLAAEASKQKNRPQTVDDLLNDADDKLTTKKDDFDVANEAKTAARKLNVQGDIYKSSELRQELARMVTDPRNRYFSRNLANRVWGELLGRGFVNPVDDFREDNPPSHTQALDFLADEFVASGYDFRTLVRLVVTSKAYARAHLPQSVNAILRDDSEKAFTSATVRRMVSEAMFDSLVQAGHLFNIKHREGDNMVTVTMLVQEAVDMKDDGKGTKEKDKKKVTAKPLMAGPGMSQPGYDLERGIEVNFKDALRRREAIDIEAMSAMSNEEIEAQQMMQKPDGKKSKMITRKVEKVIDDNPKFTSSMRMASPAPVGHFLRVFGQTDRAALDDRRDHSPSMRQALMMLNGKLTNEAARVGPLEPLYVLMEGDKADMNKAISLVYREILTREPSALERDEALKIIREGATPMDGMADLRWALLNCHEFKFLP